MYGFIIESGSQTQPKLNLENTSTMPNLEAKIKYIVFINYKTIHALLVATLIFFVAFNKHCHHFPKYVYSFHQFYVTLKGHSKATVRF